MPIIQFTSEEAARNLRSERACRWPDGRASNVRLDGLTKIAIKPSFSFTKTDRIFTIGSCFAREIEKYMSDLGFDLPSLAINIPSEERSSKTANDILNKYTVHSMENELKWAFYGNDIDPKDFYLTADDDLWHDAQMVHNLKAATLDRVIERRQLVTNLMKQVPTCRILVITLGLGEAWFDNKIGIYLNGMPPQAAINKDSRRFSLHLLGHDEMLAALERIHAILKDHGHPDFKILLTVSPVPFKATFTGQDALIANTYSKSVQRAAAEAFAIQHTNVDYFPSYEIVTLTDRKFAYELDNIHVTKNMVAHIMSTVVSAYDNVELPTQTAELSKTRTSPSTSATLRVRGKVAMSERDYDAAITAYSALLFRFGQIINQEEEFEVRLNLGISLLRSKLTNEGVIQLQRAKELAPMNSKATYKLGLGYARITMDQEALEMFREACRLNPNERDYHWRLGVQLIRMGKLAEGLQSVRNALNIDPTHQDSLDIVAKYDLVNQDV
ncbi:MAG: GSCFA domain-containing protein [Sulfuritalea sp.]|nr:GSCFA domain-containing protein [Sulfuritalea sp.]